MVWGSRKISVKNNGTRRIKGVKSGIYTKIDADSFSIVECGQADSSGKTCRTTADQ